MTSQTAPATGNPPKPCLALAVGVVGHRPDRLPAEALDRVRSDIADALDAVRRSMETTLRKYHSVWAGDTALVTVVAALAEGADRLVAQAALERGFSLDAPLPFAAAEYQRDFASAESQAEFLALLQRARNVLELPGERKSQSAAYERVGTTVLGLSDIMLAVWDGGPSGGRGGTTEIVLTAIRRGLPVIHIDAKGAAPPRVMWGEFEQLKAPLETIDGVPSKSIAEGVPLLIDALVRPPSDPLETRKIERYFREPVRGNNWRIEFPLLMTIAGVRTLHRSDLSPPDPTSSARRLAAAAAKLGSGTLVLSEPFGWASAIARHFAQTFRSAYVANFVLAALAIVAAATSLLVEDQLPLALLEGFLIIGIVANTVVGRQRGWHIRWIEAREVSERLRAAVSLWSVALRPASFQGEEPSWTGWYSRALVRQQGMRSGTLRDDGLKLAREALVELVADQREYNEGTAERMSKLEHRLEVFGLALFIATGLFTLDHVIGSPLLHLLTPSIFETHIFATVLGASLPALATASYGIRVIGDLEGVARRAERTEAALGNVLAMIEAETLDLGVLRSRTRAVAEIMLSDVANWRLSAESRGLAIPG